MKINKKKLLGIGFSDLKIAEVLEYIDSVLKNYYKKVYFVTPNPEILMLANGQNSYKSILNSAELALPDGVGVTWASKFLGNPIYNRIPGVDLVEILCKHASEKPITVGFLGGGPGVAEKTSKCLTKKYPKLNVLFTYSGFPDSETVKTVRGLVTKSREKKLDLLFVAFGSPKQEVWIAQNIKELPASITIGVGGAFDFISGKVKRAPLWIRRIGLEWLFRLFLEPWRIKRQLSLVGFVFLVLKQKMFAKT